MDTAARHPRRPDVSRDRGGHGGWPAEVDLALGNVRDEPPEMLGREQAPPFLRLMIAGDDVEHDAV